MQHNSMGEHTEKQFVYLRQKQGRKTHPERKGVGIPPNEGAQWRGGLNHLSRTVLPGLCLHLANYLVSFFTPAWSQDPPQHACSIFAKMDPTPEACGCMSTLIMGWHPLSFWPPRSLPAHVQTGKFSLTSGVVILSLQQSSASSTSFVLGVSGGKQSFNFTPLDKHQLSSPGAHLSPTSVQGLIQEGEPIPQETHKTSAVYIDRSIGSMYGSEF